jgi:tRNA pseudouridine55 synthase
LALVQLGVTTTTGDAEGEVLERNPCKVSQDAIEPVLSRFRGDLEQVPPMYSALKQAGRPLYALAREGREVPRAARRIRVHALEHLSLSDDRLELRIRCSKGTYIRTLAEDIGRALGCGAHLAALRRTASGSFRIEQTSTLDELVHGSPAERDAKLLPVEHLLGELPRVDLPQSMAERFVQGQALQVEHTPAGPCGVYGHQGKLLGLGEGGAEGQLHPRRLLICHASG